MKTMTRVLAGLLLLLAVGTVSLAGAATITIVNIDGAGEGFNDPTPAAPVGGNTGVTVGEQRLKVFEHAAGIWGGILVSDVEIFVTAAFNPQTCTPTSAVLGSAGPTFVFRDFPNAEFPGTWYHSALADRRAEVELNPGPADINAQFNSNLNGNPACLGGTGWYYGFDGLEGTNIELLPVVLHELGHGLGFSTFVNRSTGAEFLGFQDIYEHYLRDNNLGLRWTSLTNAQRVASAISLNKLTWDGPEVLADAPNWLGPRQVLRVTSPALGDLLFGTASFGPALGATTISGELVLAIDGVAPVNDGCSAIGNVAGKIALIDRGTCSFVSKAQAAQAGGAIAVIIANNAAGPAPGLGGTDPTITIPVVSVSQADGNLLKANLPGVMITLTSDPLLLAGADNAGRPLMFAPNPLQGGSSTSHWDVSATPNLLMEPAINGNLSSSVDLTRAHFVDIGWFPNYAPDCSGAVAMVEVICPQKKQFVPVTILGVTDRDGDPVTITVTGITQDEPVFGKSDKTCPDGKILDGNAQIRAEESGRHLTGKSVKSAKNGRVYVVSFTADDGRGGTCDGTVSVCVPRKKACKSTKSSKFPAPDDPDVEVCVDDGQLYNSLGPCKSGHGHDSDVIVQEMLDLRLVSMQGGTAVFEYALPADAEVSLDVYDVAGRKMATLDKGLRAAGTHRVSWSSAGRGQGVYFYRLVTPDATLKRSVLHVN